jgi:hypothetical protein
MRHELLRAPAHDLEVEQLRLACAAAQSECDPQGVNGVQGDDPTLAGKLFLWTHPGEPKPIPEVVSIEQVERLCST